MRREEGRREEKGGAEKRGGGSGRTMMEIVHASIYVKKGGNIQSIEKYG